MKVIHITWNSTRVFHFNFSVYFNECAANWQKVIYVRSMLDRVAFGKFASRTGNLRQKQFTAVIYIHDQLGSVRMNWTERVVWCKHENGGRAKFLFDRTTMTHFAFIPFRFSNYPTMTKYELSTPNNCFRCNDKRLNIRRFVWHIAEPNPIYHCSIFPDFKRRGINTGITIRKIPHRFRIKTFRTVTSESIFNWNRIDVY